MQLYKNIIQLEKYIFEQEYKGYDPYDTLNSWVPFKILGKWPSAIAIQIQKRNPYNIRPLLGIKKQYNPKAMGLFLQAYSILYQKDKDEIYIKKADFFFNWLKENYSKNYAGYAWGYNFPWSNPHKYLDAFVPTAVVTGFVAKGIYEYYTITKSAKALSILESLCLFLDKNLKKHIDQTGISISYTPVVKDICYNASLLAAEAFAKTASINGNEYLKDLAIKAVDFVIDKQHSDGRWNYAISLDLSKEEPQIDFHQGYVLESIYEIAKVLNIQNQTWNTALNKGLKFYIETQFDDLGRSYWRWPKKMPVEIHNQTQGIITLIKLKRLHPKAASTACKIANWTINNMQDKTGYFYYQKHRFYTNKISYMRWSNAWMFLALIHLLNYNNEN